MRNLQGVTPCGGDTTRGGACAVFPVRMCKRGECDHPIAHRDATCRCDTDTCRRGTRWNNANASRRFRSHGTRWSPISWGCGGHSICRRYYCCDWMVAAAVCEYDKVASTANGAGTSRLGRCKDHGAGSRNSRRLLDRIGRMTRRSSRWRRSTHRWVVVFSGLRHGGRLRGVQSRRICMRRLSVRIGLRTHCHGTHALHFLRYLDLRRSSSTWSWTIHFALSWS